MLASEAVHDSRGQENPRYSGDCSFCRIVRGEAEASFVAMEEQVTAFMDIRPINRGHVLVVPLSHAADLSELEEEVGGKLFELATRVAGALRRCGVRCEGVNLLLSDGEVAGQVVLHVHLHVIPRFRGDGFAFRPGPGFGRAPDREELSRVADQVRGSLR